MSQKLLGNIYKWIKDTLRFAEKFTENYNENYSDKGYILEVYVKYRKKLHAL